MLAKTRIRYYIDYKRKQLVFNFTNTTFEVTLNWAKIWLIHAKK